MSAKAKRIRANVTYPAPLIVRDVRVLVGDPVDVNLGRTFVIASGPHVVREGVHEVVLSGLVRFLSSKTPRRFHAKGRFTYDVRCWAESDSVIVKWR